MPLSCVACKEQIKSECAECSECKQRFHFECSINEVVYRKKINSKQPWKCSTCLRRHPKKVEAEETNEKYGPAGANWRNEFMNEIKNIVSPLQEAISEIKKDMVDLKQFAQHASDNYDEFLLEIKGLKAEVSTMKKEYHILNTKLSEKNKAIFELSEKINQLEQYGRNKNIVINGIPITSGEDCKTIVKNVAQEFGVAIDIKEIDVAHRLKTGNKLQQPPTIAQFGTRTTRDLLLTKKKLILTEHTFRGMKVGDAIHLNEHLTPSSSNLLRFTKKIARERGYKYVWFRGGKVLVRESDDSAVFIIHTEDEVLGRMAVKEMVQHPNGSPASVPDMTQEVDEGTIGETTH